MSEGIMNHIIEIRFYSGGVQITRHNKKRRNYAPYTKTRMILEGVVVSLSQRDKVRVNYLHGHIVSFEIV